MFRVFKSKKGRLLGGAFAASITTVVALTSFNSFLFQASILDVPEHKPFDGTVAPVDKSPDWVKFKSEDWDKSYNELSSSKLMDFPEYDVDRLNTATDSLVWGNKSHDQIRNEKITFSVPWMGNYKLDHKQDGSHPAVDIKLLMDTPIQSIMNGTVIKASSQSSGFGHHVVLQHNNVPSLDDPNEKVTLFSSYSHCSKLLVEVGEVVDKGDRVCLSGSTGTSTTPHLHFQLDNDNADWHPFWPFTWQDVADAGLDFFSAVNEGLGASTARKTTIDPMLYVQKYMDEDFIAEVSEEEEEVEETEEEVEEVEGVEGPEAESYVEEAIESNTEESEEEVSEEILEEEIIEETVVEVEKEMSIDILVKEVYFEGQNLEFTINLRDQFGDPYIDGTGYISIIPDRSNFRVDSPIIKFSDFDSDTASYVGEIEKIFDTTEDRIKLEIGDEVVYSDYFDIQASEQKFSDIPVYHEHYESTTFLSQEGIINGFDDGTFRPSQTVTRVEALKLILESINARLKSGDVPFVDVSLSEWYADYLYTAYSNEIVDGNPDGTFEPSNTVNRAAFFKILFNGMGVDINPNVEEKPYADVPVEAWFAPYIAYAKQIGIIDEDATKIYPDAFMTRGEVADAMYKLMQLLN